MTWADPVGSRSIYTLWHEAMRVYKAMSKVKNITM